MKVRQLIARLLECDQEAEAAFEIEGSIYPVEGVNDRDYVAWPQMKRGVTEDTSRLYIGLKRQGPSVPRGWQVIGPPRPAIIIE